jgi:hypothetical protein
VPDLEVRLKQGKPRRRKFLGDQHNRQRHDDVCSRMRRSGNPQSRATLPGTLTSACENIHKRERGGLRAVLPASKPL